jgi:hypothetical protein
MTLLIMEFFPTLLFRSHIYLACVPSYSEATDRCAMDGGNEDARDVPLSHHSSVPLQPHVALINKPKTLAAREFELHK